MLYSTLRGVSALDFVFAFNYGLQLEFEKKRKIKTTEVITLENHNRNKQSTEPEQNLRKTVQPDKIGFRFIYNWLGK